jgi:hypothetical protein
MTIIAARASFDQAVVEESLPWSVSTLLPWCKYQRSDNVRVERHNNFNYRYYPSIDHMIVRTNHHVWDSTAKDALGAPCTLSLPPGSSRG